MTNEAITSDTRFAYEEVESTRTYGSGYKGPKPLADQVMILRTHFPHCGSFDEILAAKQVPSLMEGHFAIPHWSLIGSTYQEVVERVMAVITSKRTFVNFLKGQLGPQQLKETAKKAKAFQALRKEQEGHGILIVAGQFGRHHAGMSVRRAREVMTDREFGFGAYEVAILLLTHPERLVDCNDLWIDCAGDEYAPKAGGAFSEYPYWSFRGDELRFSSVDVDCPGEGCGSASGCLPE